MWDVVGVAQRRTAPYRTYPANTSGRLPLPEPWDRIPGKWDWLGHDDLGSMSHKPREMGQLGTWPGGGSDEIGKFTG